MWARMTFTPVLEALLAVGLVLVTIPLHEYGHKFAYRVLGFDSHIIWRNRTNEHWWSACVSCVPEESFGNFLGTPLEYAFIDGSGGAAQSLAFAIPMLFLKPFLFLTIGWASCLLYMLHEIIVGYLVMDWAPEDQKECGF